MKNTNQKNDDKAQEQSEQLKKTSQENATMDQKVARVVMRAYAKLYRETLVFARRYQAYNPPIFEKWCVKAGIHLAEAIRNRDRSQAV